jgi:putative glycosyltransferase (TIGR04372 family)
VNLKSKLYKKWLVLNAIGLKKSLMIPFAVIFVLSLKFLTIFRDVRIHTVKNHRLGHFATNTELSRLNLIEKHRITQRKQINIYCFQTAKHSNSYFAEMWRRELFVLKTPFGQLTYDIAKRFTSNLAVKSTAIDSAGLLTKYIPSLTFLNSELSEGFKFLDNLGGKSEKGFVCLNVRDDQFFAKTEPVGWHTNRDWSYHNYRDSDIKTYVAAAEALANMGYTVFRMGAIVKEPLISKHPRVIDYATNGMRTEFLDIFLGAHCVFTISVGSGWDSVPTIFRRPLMFVNQLPVFAPSVATLPIVTYPKILLDDQTGDTLNLKNLIDREIVHRANSQAYKDAGVEIRDLSSEELVEAVTEMAQRVEGTFVETPEQKEMQAKLKHILSTHPKLQPSPNYYPIRAQFASCFLSRYPNFLD